MTYARDPRLLDEALKTLGVDHLAFGIHQSAFPADTWDVGTGCPASRAGVRLLGFVRALGFDTVQLGPEGQVSAHNPSPYDATVFARSLALIDPFRLTQPEDGKLLDEETLRATCTQGAPHDRLRSDIAAATPRLRSLLTHAQRRLAAAPDHPLWAALSEFRTRQAAWLSRDVLFEVMGERIGHDDPHHFDPAVLALFPSTPDGAERRRSLRAVLGDDLMRRELGQLLAQRHAQAFRNEAHALGMRLFGDLQVGWSHRDRFLHGEAFTSRWLLGAPPSRTNPAGQPWGYPVLDPEQLDDRHSPARRLLELRLQRAFETHDGLRIDHPHGLVCPWVYLAGAADPTRAVQQGTRAFESPDSTDPELRRWAIARADDLDLTVARHDDGWVARADAAQIARWSRLMDAVLDVAAAYGHGRQDIAAEVLSTCPAPLRHVLRRHGLGQFRVTQKANVDDPADVYRTDQATPADWVMLGNHDTPPILQVAERWLGDGSAGPRARYLASRLQPDPAQRDAAAAAYCRSPGTLAQAHLADLFASEARNVQVYFIDLFGEADPFNRPGVVHPDNWVPRLPGDFEQMYTRRCAEGRALDVGTALATALRARGANDLARALTP